MKLFLGDKLIYESVCPSLTQSKVTHLLYQQFMFISRLPILDLCGCPTFCGSLVFLVVYLPVCLYVCLSILYYFTIFQFLNLWIYLLVYLSNSLFLCSSICLFVEWSVFSIFLFVCFHSLFFNCLVPMDNISVFN